MFRNCCSFSSSSIFIDFTANCITTVSQLEYIVTTKDTRSSWEEELNILTVTEMKCFWLLCHKKKSTGRGMRS